MQSELVVAKKDVPSVYLAGCDDEMVKAVTGHSGVEMLKKYGGPIRQRELAKRARGKKSNGTKQVRNVKVSTVVSKMAAKEKKDDASH